MPAKATPNNVRSISIHPPISIPPQHLNEPTNSLLDFFFFSPSSLPSSPLLFFFFFLSFSPSSPPPLDLSFLPPLSPFFFSILAFLSWARMYVQSLWFMSTISLFPHAMHLW